MDQTFLKVRVKNLVKVTKIREVMGRKIPPTLRKPSFKFRNLKHVVLIIPIIIRIIINLGKIREERPPNSNFK